MNGPSAEETVELMRAMGQVNRRIPGVQLGIADGSLPPDDQTRFGDLLITLGNLVREHASARAATLVARDAESP
jgi:hypothetical protein